MGEKASKAAARSVFYEKPERTRFLNRMLKDFGQHRDLEEKEEV